MKMKFTIKIISLCLAVVLCLSIFIARGSKEAPDDEAAYHQLTFDGSAGVDLVQPRAVWNDPNGKGNLLFNWEEEEGTQMVALLSTGSGFVRNYPSSNPTEEELQEEMYHTFLTIRPKEDLHKASFTTVRYYNSDEMAGATDIFAVGPLKATDYFGVGYGKYFQVRMEMPATFTQTESQNPEFLRDYMMMYGHATMQNGNASIHFKHIPAIFRFIITNKRPDDATIESVSMTIDGQAPIGAKVADVSGSYAAENFRLMCSESLTSITTNLNATLESQQSYTAYTMALPLPVVEEKETLEGKEVKFIINTAEHGFLSFVLTGEQIANANPDHEYDWVGGKSYTIRMSLSDVLTFEGITVEDWNDGGTINAPIATAEWVNGFSESGEPQPAKLNDKGEYEVSNAGNLVWMSQQINARTLSIPYTIKLVDDITIGEDIEWVPIAHPRGTQYSSVFDGNGHTLTINQDRPEATYENFGLFKSFDYSTVKNLTIKGNISLNTNGTVGAIAATAYRTTISGVISYANITNRSDDGMVGGLVGQFGGQHSESDNQYSLIENCAVYADVSGGTAGGIIGYGWSGSEYYDIKNTAFYGDVTGQNCQGAIIGFHGNDQTAPSCTFKHIYYYEQDALGFSGGGSTNYTLGTDVAAKTIEEFASPQMAELLNADQTNGPWEYLTGDDYPVLKRDME